MNASAVDHVIDLRVAGSSIEIQTDPRTLHAKIREKMHAFARNTKLGGCDAAMQPSILAATQHDGAGRSWEELLCDSGNTFVGICIPEGSVLVR